MMKWERTNTGNYKSEKGYIYKSASGRITKSTGWYFSKRLYGTDKVFFSTLKDAKAYAESL